MTEKESPSSTNLLDSSIAQHQDEHVDSKTASQLLESGTNDKLMHHPHHPTLRTDHLLPSLEEQTAPFVDSSYSSTTLGSTQHNLELNHNSMPDHNFAHRIDTNPVLTADGQGKRSKSLLVLALVGEYCRFERDAAAAAKQHTRDSIKGAETQLALWAENSKVTQVEKERAESDFAELPIEMAHWSKEREQLVEEQKKRDQQIIEGKKELERSSVRLRGIKARLDAGSNVDLSHDEFAEHELECASWAKHLDRLEDANNVHADLCKRHLDLIDHAESDLQQVKALSMERLETINLKLQYEENQQHCLQETISLLNERMQMMQEEEQEWETIRIAVTAVGRMETCKTFDDRKRQ